MAGDMFVELTSKHRFPKWTNSVEFELTAMEEDREPWKQITCPPWQTIPQKVLVLIHFQIIII